LGGERTGDDGQLVVGLDEAQLFDESVVTHIGCAGELVTSLRHCFRNVPCLGWVESVSLGEALEVLGGGGLDSGFAKGWGGVGFNMVVEIGGFGVGFAFVFLSEMVL
jgi:hypothetical protein